MNDNPQVKKDGGLHNAESSSDSQNEEKLSRNQTAVIFNHVTRLIKGGR